MADRIPVLKPPPIEPGDTLAVVAPASAPFDPERLPAGLERLRRLGFRIETARTDFSPYGYLAGPDAVRLEELNGFLRREDIKAILCVRGGYGVLRLLPHLDYEAAARRPKLIVGYSDITALHLAMVSQIGLTGLSGPMVAAEWWRPDPVSERLFWPLAQGAAPGPVEGPEGPYLGSLRPGTAEGMLVGGNLTLLTRLIGTPYLPPLDGAILFFEEIGEQPYRLDGVLAQWKLSGWLDRLGGVVIGAVTAWEPEEGRPTFTPDEVFAAYFGDAPYPVATGLVYGHFPAKATLPVGVRARLTVGGAEARLELLERVTDGAARRPVRIPEDAA